MLTHISAIRPRRSSDATRRISALCLSSVIQNASRTKLMIFLFPSSKDPDALTADMSSAYAINSENIKQKFWVFLYTLNNTSWLIHMFEFLIIFYLKIVVLFGNTVVWFLREDNFLYLDFPPLLFWIWKI